MVTRVIDKALAGEPDLLWGISTQSQMRDEITYSIPRIDKIHPVDTINDLITLSVANEDFFFSKVEVLGFAAKGDGGGGLFWFSATEPHANQNGSTIIQATGTSIIGCWIKQQTEQDEQVNFTDISADVNISNKFEGKQMWDITNKQPVWSTGITPGALWVDGIGATKHTPI